MDRELREMGETVSLGVSSGDGWKNLAPLESVIDVGDNEIADSKARSNGSALNDDAPVEEKSSSAVIGIECNYDVVVGENQRVCRICHLNAKESGKSSKELIELGCGCRGELRVAHSDCAEAWFRVRGNRLCEICGIIAQNIKGINDNGFMVAWNERSADMPNASSDSGRRCLRGQPLCNFLMACLVIAFVLPWFLRVNMF